MEDRTISVYCKKCHGEVLILSYEVLPDSIVLHTECANLRCGTKITITVRVTPKLVDQHQEKEK